jgi:predicted house-cleaning NTP pyrophosphatase (Maf/HAM1 superfamily)
MAEGGCNRYSSASGYRQNMLTRVRLRGNMLSSTWQHRVPAQRAMLTNRDMAARKMKKLSRRHSPAVMVGMIQCLKVAHGHWT